MEYFLPLLLDGPLQSWGSTSRFHRRSTGLYPTKSGVIGMICAAMGWEKRPKDEKLQHLAELPMHVVFLPKLRQAKPQAQWASRSGLIKTHRIEDYHTVGGGFDPKTRSEFIPRTALGKPDKDATISRREYLTDARFGVILMGDFGVLSGVAKALRNPVWGIWLGRKSCIPSTPVLIDDNPFQSRNEAWAALLKVADLPAGIPFGAFGLVEEITALTEAHVTVMDQPVSFGDGTSSGPDKRKFAHRRIRIQQGLQTD